MLMIMPKVAIAVRTTYASAELPNSSVPIYSLRSLYVCIGYSVIFYSSLSCPYIKLAV